MKRTKPVNLTTHERALIMLYRLAPDENRAAVDAAVWRASMVPDQKNGWNKQCDALTLNRHSANILTPFMAAAGDGAQ